MKKVADRQERARKLRFNPKRFGLSDQTAGLIHVADYFESPELQGLGIGLTIVREAVRALGGEVEIGPRAGGGTTARVVLPAADGPAP